MYCKLLQLICTLFNNVCWFQDCSAFRMSSEPIEEAVVGSVRNEFKVRLVSERQQVEASKRRGRVKRRLLSYLRSKSSNLIACAVHVDVYGQSLSRRLYSLHQSTAASTWWCKPRPRFAWVEIAVGLSEGPSYPGHSPRTNHFFPCCPLNNRRRATCNFFKIGRRSSLFFHLSLAHFLNYSPLDERQPSSQPWSRLSLSSVHWK